MDKIRLAIAGLGQRGYGMIGGFLLFKEVEVVALCDVYQDRVDRAFDKVKELRGNEPRKYLEYSDLLKDKGFDAIYIASSWDEHISMAIDSLNAGIVTALEVGGAYSIDECFDLVKAYEKTKTPFMLMENCCFGRFELLCTSLARKGMLGEIVHCRGAYAHDLRDEILGGVVNRHYRLDNYKKRNCDNYPTHALGPLSKILDINRGNRFMSLASFASKSAGLKEFTTNKLNPDKNQIGETFKQGDIVNTIITCANGVTILLTLDTTLPRSYSREFTVRGTKGLCVEDLNMIMTDERDEIPHEAAPSTLLNKADNYNDMLPRLWKDITEEELEAGHGGMDYLMLKTFVNCLKENKEFPIDVYDAASWMSITALSEKSIALGGAVVDCPDFTKGKWIKRERKDVTEI